MTRQLRAIDFVEEPNEDAIVDFEGLARAFFGSRCLAASGSSPEVVAHAPDVIINFLRYVLRHNVLPEFWYVTLCLQLADFEAEISSQDINAAIQIAELAKAELVATKQFSFLAPGPLNSALSAYCGGYYCGLRSRNLWNVSSQYSGFHIDEEPEQTIARLLPDLAIEPNILQRQIGMPVEVILITNLSSQIMTLTLKPWQIPGAEEFEQYQTDLNQVEVLCEKTIAANVFNGMHL